ncbi:50S ribosomal protein L4 [Geotalea uraniireducens]|uniref:Large ribosomal subunit protein uL4 n=1 Tax=Geotalea uraniireducens TaxID=351604 RepID=A0ABM8EP84_9BACT|nr:50S ribosomal protein L4 [Geotalea uraniireducens]BDV44265.1 50S ribosomal protein L4 [Geotalea uraniireducens]
MATIDVFDLKKNKVAEMSLDDAVFNGEVKEYLIHEAIKVQLANRRAGTVAVKNRSAVSGGGKKPYRQKGTGQARQGCIRAPHYVGGGVAFGPQPKVYNLSMNKKARKAAVRSALSMLYKGNKLSVVNAFDLPSISTKSFVGVMKAFEVDKTLVVLDSPNANLELSARNVKHVKVVKADQLSVYDIVRYNNIILTEAAVRTVEGVLQS